MLHNKLFHELIDTEDGGFIESDLDEINLLKLLKEKFSLSHIAYLGINLPIEKDNGNYIIATYSDEWVERYVSQNYVKIDPVIQFGLQGIVPVDWADLPKNSKKVIQLFGEAQEFGLGNQGLSIPIRGRHGETAMFSINKTMGDGEWKIFRKKIMQELQIHAYNFHMHVLKMNGVEDFKAVALSEREKEVLTWASKGKTAWEIATILGIKQPTVNFFFENCRSKLSVVNTTQAVVKAIRLALI